MLLFWGEIYVLQDRCHKIRCIYRSEICVHEPRPWIAAVRILVALIFEFLSIFCFRKLRFLASLFLVQTTNLNSACIHGNKHTD